MNDQRSSSDTVEAALYRLLETNIPGCLDSSWEGQMIRPERLTALVGVILTQFGGVAQAVPGWIDQNHQIDRYGVALMMIREGCADPAGLARRILSEFGSSMSSTDR